MTDRLKKAIEAGSMVALLRELRGWDTSEVEALIDDAGAFYAEEIDRIQKLTNEAISHPEIFFSDSATAKVTTADRDARINALAITSEVTLAAQIRLGNISNPPLSEGEKQSAKRLMRAKKAAQGIANDSQSL